MQIERHNGTKEATKNITLRQAKENNGSKRVTVSEETKVVMDAESGEKGK